MASARGTQLEATRLQALQGAASSSTGPVGAPVVAGEIPGVAPCREYKEFADLLEGRDGEP